MYFAKLAEVESATGAANVHVADSSAAENMTERILGERRGEVVN